MDLSLSQSVGECLYLRANIMTMQDANELYSKNINAEGVVEVNYPLFVQIMYDLISSRCRIHALENQVAELETSADQTTGEIWNKIVGAGQ